MSVVLTFDRGNSSTKAVAYDIHSGEETASALLRGPQANATLRRLVDSLLIEAVVGCTVAGDCLDELYDATGATTRLTLTHDTPVPIANLYETPHTLGADRLAAAIGAATIHPGEELLVADLGTACTYDFVSAQGEFLGGNIACGPGMRLRALHHYTSRLPLVSGHFDDIAPYGRTTEQAMRSGAMQGVVAELMLYRGTNRQLILSGGWAPEIARLLPEGTPYEIQPHLVNRGLFITLKHNLAL